MNRVDFKRGQRVIIDKVDKISAYCTTILSGDEATVEWVHSFGDITRLTLSFNHPIRVIKMGKEYKSINMWTLNSECVQRA